MEEAIAPAVAIARSGSAESAAEILIDLAEILFSDGHDATARRLVKEASAYQISGDHRRWFQKSLAVILAQAGDWTGALRVVAMLPMHNEINRDYLLQEIARILLASGKLPAARRVIGHIESKQHQVESLEDLAIAFAQRGYAAKASATILSMRGTRLAVDQRRSAWYWIAQWHAYRGDRAAALAAVKRLPGVERRALTLAAMAVCAAAEREPPLPIRPGGIPLNRRRRRPDPQIYLDRARTAARRLHQAHVSFEIGLAAARIGNMAIARDALKEIAGSFWSRHASAIKREIAVAEARSGRYDDAKRTALRIRAKGLRAMALAGIASAEAAAGHRSAATATAAGIPLAEYRAAALLTVGREAAACGYPEEAGRTFRSIVPLLEERKQRIIPQWIGSLCREVAVEQARIGDFCGAGRTVVTVSKHLKCPSILKSTALAFAEAGNYPAALCFARRLSAATDYAPLLVQIELVKHGAHLATGSSRVA